MLDKIDTKIIFKNINKKILTIHTKYELSQKMNIKPQTLQNLLKNLEQGKAVTTKTLNKIAAAADIEITDLLF